MDRSLFPEAVEVHQTHLQNTEDTRAFHILKRWTDGANMGVATGLEVTVSATATLVDIAAGTGYAPNGEYIEVTAGQTGVALSNYATGVDNYVCLVYTETSTHPEAAATGGRTRQTRAERSFRVRVFTLTELQALVASSDDLSVDATDRVLVIAVVNANGPTVALTTNDISLPPDAVTVLLGIDQPTTITGVVVVAIDPDTTQSKDVALGGNVQARIAYAAGATPPSTATLTYRAPGDATAGDAVAIATSGTYRLYTDAGSTGNWIDVEVTTSMLPLVASFTGNDDLTVYDVYFHAAQRASAADYLHRGSLGTGAPNTQNPHGTRVRDLDDRLVEARWGVVLGSLLQSTLAQALVPRIVTEQSAFGGGRTLVWDLPASGVTAHARIYIQSDSVEVVYNGRWDGTSAWLKDNDAVPAFRLAPSGAGGLGLALQSYQGAGPFGDGDWSPDFFLPVGGADATLIAELWGRLVIGDGLLGSASARTTPRLDVPFSAGGGGGDVRTLLFRSVRDDASAPATLRVYRAVTTLGGAQSNALELTLNCSWNSAANTWSKDSAAAAAAKIEFGTLNIFFAQRLAATAGTWADDAWDGGQGGFGLTAGDLTIPGRYYWSSVKTFRKSIPGFAGFIGDTTSIYSIDNSRLGAQFIAKLGVGNGQIVWPFELPNGATITGAVVNGTFSPGGSGVCEGAVIRIRNYATPTSQDLYSGGATALNAAADVALPVDQNNVVDTDSYSYAVHIRGTSDSTFSVFRIEVTYTLDHVEMP